MNTKLDNAQGDFQKILQSSFDLSQLGLVNSKASKHPFVETKIPLKFGEFNFRVYAASHGKETVVLWTDHLDISSPVLVRVHSECFTGDLFESLRCDCGPQLNKSLEMIHKEGGVLIYLRQEGRGIGLFEKIKTYQLQSKGLDTFDANVALGHRPDERTYEMAKIALDDLGIKHIRLLTNNPSKVSEIAKFGIHVAERVPIIIKPNKHNRAYFKTKSSKFHHSFEKSSNLYFYQFHVDTASQAQEVIELVKTKKRDPLLRILIGLGANSSIFSNPTEIERLRDIFCVCSLHEGFIPVLHYSFTDCSSVKEEIHKIREALPFVTRLQLNDLPSIDINDLEDASTTFSLDIPLSDENFAVIHNKKFRNFINSTNSSLLLDNSKGRGVQESKASLIEKINLLLQYGLKNIALFGGFGPNELETYFALRRYYRINFSIDAETKIKTDGKFDVEKIKVYLLQLIRFDDPKQNSIDQTKAFLSQNRRSDWEKARIHDQDFMIHPQVFHAGVFPSSAWFAEKLSKLMHGSKDFCEIGCGSGVISCLTALANSNLHVVATDINPHATENTQLNAENFGLEKRLEVKNGDVLDSIPKGQLFDAIFWALPFGFLDPGTKMSLEDMQVFDPGYRAIRKFFATAKDYLKPNGRLLIGFSSDLGHYDLIEEFAEEFNLKIVKIDERLMTETDPVNFELLEGKYI